MTPPLRILHLEDNPDDAEEIAWTFRQAGIQCHITRVEDEESYLSALRSGRFDLILSDSSVAGFSGATALEMALEADLDAPFVFVSGTAPREMRDVAVRLGAADHLAKDHRIELVFLVLRIWQRKTSERSNGQ